MSKKTYFCFDSDSNEKYVTARELVELAIKDGWTINSDVASAMRELLTDLDHKTVMSQTSFNFGKTEFKYTPPVGFSPALSLSPTPSADSQ
jgi:hypothetical protein